MNKRGNIDDIPLAMQILFFFAFVGIIMLIMNGQINSYFQSSSMVNNETKVVTDRYNSNFIIGVDYAFLLLLFGFVFFSYISASRIPVQNNAFWVLAIIIVIFVWVTSIIISNLYVTMTENSVYIQNMVSQMKFIPYIMPNMLYYAIIYTLVVGIALYTKEN